MNKNKYQLNNIYIDKLNTNYTAFAFEKSVC